MRSPFAEFAAQVCGFKLRPGICPLCEQPAVAFRDEISVKEHEITGLCQSCQDDLFKEQANEH